MFNKLSILNTETNKLLILNSIQISNKLFTTVSSQGKPTWRITYDDDEENSDFNDINSSSQKSFGEITLNKINPKKGKINLSNVNRKNNKVSIPKSSFEFSNEIDNIKTNNTKKNNIKTNNIKKINIKKYYKGKEKSTINYNNPDFEIIKSTNSGKWIFFFSLMCISL